MDIVTREEYYGLLELIDHLQKEILKLRKEVNLIKKI